MGRENKKEAIAILHREQIMKSAATLFFEKGYEQTTIEDISNLSEYSRRTIYTYYKSKEDIRQHIVEKGLMVLKQDIEYAIMKSKNFISGYNNICLAMYKYQKEYPYSMENVNNAKTDQIDFNHLSDAVKNILALGVDINKLLADFIEKGKEDGVVRQDIIPMLTVYVLWSSITALLTLAQTKGVFIEKQFDISERKFLDYGFKQIINSILETRL